MLEGEYNSTTDAHPRIFEHADINLDRGTVTNERPTAPTQVTVRDMTGSENKYTLDTHGFQLVKHQTGLAKDSFKDEEKIFSQYYKESEQVYKNLYVPSPSLRQIKSNLSTM